MSLHSRPLSPCVGSEIRADLRILLAGAHAADIRRLLEAHGVLLFRGFGCDDDNQLTFARTLGDVVLHGDNGIFKVTLDKRYNDKADYLRGAFFWHVDGVTEDVPARASLLGARRLSTHGGQTEFANTCAAYEDLPSARKRVVEKLKVVHTLESSQRLIYANPTATQRRAWARYPAKTHPLVWVHRSGRRSLLLGSTCSHIEGMDVDAGRELLLELELWATQPKYVYRHQWQLGDLVISDNAGTMHRAVPYPLGSGRLMHRTTLRTDEALA